MIVSIFAPGDVSVGIPSVYTSVDLKIEIDDEERGNIREILTNAFSEIYAGDVHVLFEDELLNKGPQIEERVGPPCSTCPRRETDCSVSCPAQFEEGEPEESNRKEAER